jgi:transcriptional regulator with XRE-family HTH domain
MEKGLPKLLKEASAASGMTRYRIAQGAGISQIVLDRFLRGERDLKLSTADKVIESLGRQLLWIRHLAEMADRSPSFAVDCAWTAVRNSVPVAMQHAPRPRKPLTMDQQIDHLLESNCIEVNEAQAIHRLHSQGEAAMASPEKLTKCQAIDFVARAAILVETLWSV